MDKIAIVTGSSSGMGVEVSYMLASAGYTTIMTARDLERAESTKRNLVSRDDSVQNLLHIAHLDLASLQSVRTFASKISQEYSSVHVLINNAGSFFKEFIPTEDRYESTFQVNYLGHYLLTNLLKDELSNGNARVVNVTSQLYKSGEISDDIGNPAKYNRMAAYNDSKMAVNLATNYLSTEWADTGVTFNSIHPGFIKTNIINHYHQPMKFLLKLLSPLMFKPSTLGAQRQVDLALSKHYQGVTGKYFFEGKEQEQVPNALDPKAQEKLIEMSNDFVGI